MRKGRFVVGQFCGVLTQMRSALLPVHLPHFDSILVRLKDHRERIGDFDIGCFYSILKFGQFLDIALRMKIKNLIG